MYVMAEFVPRFARAEQLTDSNRLGDERAACGVRSGEEQEEQAQEKERGWEDVVSASDEDNDCADGHASLLASTAQRWLPIQFRSGVCGG